MSTRLVTGRLQRSTSVAATASRYQRPTAGRASSNQMSSSNSFITKGLAGRQRRMQSDDFAYDLSNDERAFFRNYKSPMKAVPDTERELLRNGQRTAYLSQRYEYSPDAKYYFPEATSWRIGWFHHK